MRIFLLVMLAIMTLQANAGLKDLLKPEHVKTYEKQREKLKKRLEPHLGAMTFEDDLNPEYPKQVELWNYWIEKVDIHKISAESNLSNIQQVLNYQGYSFQDKYYPLKGDKQAQSEFASCMLYQVTYRKKVVIKSLEGMKKEKSLVPRVEDNNGDFGQAYQWAVNAWPESREKSIEYCDSHVVAYYKAKKKRDSDVSRLMVDIVKLDSPNLSNPDAYQHMKASAEYQSDLAHYNALWLDTEAFKAKQDEVASGVVSKRDAVEKAAQAKRKAKHEANYKRLMGSDIGKSVFQGCSVMIGRPMKGEVQMQLAHIEDEEVKKRVRAEADKEIKKTCTCWSTNLLDAGYSESDLLRISHLMEVLTPEALAYDPMGIEISKAGMGCLVEDMGITQ